MKSMQISVSQHAQVQGCFISWYQSGVSSDEIDFHQAGYAHVISTPSASADTADPKIH